ncbi:protein of unknown function DUF111 [Desulfofarcimen acetoxidans DSM 771]|uniref:Pyridinium-3,5-bisthiocarboxylic acid mononucleotide nickel insertion protein n=1 Tax=Desulfofarcimen acetoxidans (strain ATCC 49208 / DSM 771 / KCTC 5769 / VKM B-1644 / 5575) TaxID=485916 RepID=C8VVX5_DESAS|nr:nickel pincer cofactor biosynthesis protein LarC [Desulfofarcimen acetoxidans]ACV64262.1 protein of unknown function DUF111 [Desulfofarcimen acetoxidans DSM 771]
MKILYYDCFCGISGDMNLGALLDLGVNQKYLRQELSKLNLDAEYDLQIKKDIKKEIKGTRVDVILKNEKECHKRDHTHNHSHDHHHHHNHQKDKEQYFSTVHTEHTYHEHRNLKDIEHIIKTSGLNDRVKELSLNMFMKVAEAEAMIHGNSPYEVHFHEVGATDSIIDIVGAAVCLDYLKVDKIMSSSVQLGGGFVKCAHGIIPIPAPATVEILKGVPIKFGNVPFETTTPTGAAILAANVDKFTDMVHFSIGRTGYGIGHRDMEIPNILRVYLANEEKNEEIETQYILETNIDDMNPELYGYIEEKLFERGALDVFKTPISMKKGRSAIKLSILIDEGREKDILDIVFRETTSIGIRKYKVEKIMLQRDFVRVKTQYGDITIKNSYYQGEKVKYKPEYEDCRKIASEKNIPISSVYREVYKIIEEC